MHAKMNKEKTTVGGGAKGEEECAMRITRARARALEGVCSSSRPSFKKGPGSKRAAATAGKSRTMLTDVTNILSSISHDKCIKPSKFQARGDYKKKNTKLASDISKKVSSTQEDVRAKLVEDSSTIAMVGSHDSDTNVAERLDDRGPLRPCTLNSMRERVIADPLLSMQDSVKSDELMSSPNQDIDMLCDKLRASDGLGIVDIDSEIKDTLVWSSYAPDIYNNIRFAEHEKRLSSNYMDKLQQDITPGMRGILVDWLVEVSDEYKKYEEICAPRVEEFCLITDNTYTKAEVLKMEREVLNLLHFQLSVPTTKTFLRRFIQAAQSSYKVPYVELEFLANYLAELTLVEYSFLQFLPSMIAASSVLLARWTLNHSEHPWNPTLEHYTNYKASELKTTVLALADLQLNTKGSFLNAIREKYKQQKFKCVANLSPKPVQSLFQLQV